MDIDDKESKQQANPSFHDWVAFVWVGGTLGCRLGLDRQTEDEADWNATRAITAVGNYEAMQCTLELESAF